MTTPNSKWLVGKTIARVDMHPFARNADGTGTAHDPTIHFTDGSSIVFMTEETEVDRYGTAIHLVKPPAAWIALVGERRIAWICRNPKQHANKMRKWQLNWTNGYPPEFFHDVTAAQKWCEALHPRDKVSWMTSDKEPR